MRRPDALTRRRQRQHLPQRGVSVIEALVALLLLSIGMLGMASLHGRAIQYGTDAQDRVRAAMLANELVASLWATRSNTLSAAAIEAWQTRVSDAANIGLPNASGSVSTPDSNGVVTITITWRPPARPSAEGNLQYVTKVSLP